MWFNIESEIYPTIVFYQSWLVYIFFYQCMFMKLTILDYKKLNIKMINIYNKQQLIMFF
jgi:hypothetical protein